MIREYELTEGHRIDGVWRDAGYRFSVMDQVGDWLVDGLGKARRVADQASPAIQVRAPATPQIVFSQPARTSSCCGGWRKK